MVFRGKIKIIAMSKYNFRKIEKKWQGVWRRKKYQVYHVEETDKKPKMYILDMFPYPSGDGLHVGHVEGYTASDILSRFYRMKGFNVLHPMGWDAFGLPAENYAIKKQIHPVIVVKKNIKRFEKQMRSLGLGYDWRRKINTTDPGYYKWTQWIFLQLFKKGLAYLAEIPVNWCPSCKTVLANEEVINNTCERCQSEVERKNLKQWNLRITAYADRLLTDLDRLDWPEKVKEMQRNWIGRSQGFAIAFRGVGLDFSVDVFTTRPDTLPGASFVVLAPEHPLLEKILHRLRNPNEIKTYIQQVKQKSDREKAGEEEKTGVQLKGVKVVNPITKNEISIWVSDYVLAHHGTGAVMGVPAHDARDFQFAQKFNLPIVQVIKPKEGKEVKLPYLGLGVMINSGLYDGVENEVAKEEIMKAVSGKTYVGYKLHDWVFSRQRYWGEPIPIIYCRHCWQKKSSSEKTAAREGTDYTILGGAQYALVPVLEKDLPIKLPNVKSYEPTGKPESPLAGIQKWLQVKCPNCGGVANRETNTMPQWAGSCWYYLRYLDPKNSKEMVDVEEDRYWMPVDLYIGGVEHAVLHLLYARFWHKFLYDLGAVITEEPFKRLINQGLILGPDGLKMSKSRGNVVNPDDMVLKFGADSLRLYEMFMGPLEDAKPWQPDGIIGTHRFLNRLWTLAMAYKTEKRRRGYRLKEVAQVASPEIEKLIHQTIKKVSGDIQGLRLNTAISALMVALNGLEKEFTANPLSLHESLSTFAKLLFPFAPHVSQELWQKLGNKTLLDAENWPEWDEKLVKEENFDLVIQVNGKLRATVKAAAGIGEEEAKKIALSLEVTQKWVDAKKVKKIVFVKDRLINFIV